MPGPEEWPSRRKADRIRLTGPAATYNLRSLDVARDFACALPLRSRSQSGSTYRSGCHLQFEVPRRRSGFRLRPLASLTVAKRLNLQVRLSLHFQNIFRLCYVPQ